MEKVAIWKVACFEDTKQEGMRVCLQTPTCLAKSAKLKVDRSRKREKFSPYLVAVLKQVHRFPGYVQGGCILLRLLDKR